MNSTVKIFAASLSGGLVAGLLVGVLLMLALGLMVNGMLNNAVQQAQNMQIGCISIDGNIFYCRLQQPEEQKQGVIIMYPEDDNDENDEDEVIGEKA